MEPSGGTKTLVDASGLGCIGTPKIVEEEAVPEPNNLHQKVVLAAANTVIISYTFFPSTK